MRKLISVACVSLCAVALLGTVMTRAAQTGKASSAAGTSAWASDGIWYDGLVEKATYKASQTIYGKPREFTAVFLTNKEQHDTATNTKSSASSQTVEVWKHNQIEVVPTPNYDYKFVATSHVRVGDGVLSRLDVSSQEFCGASFKQYAIKLDRQNKPGWTYFGFSYMPESGRVDGYVEGRDEKVVAFNALPLWLRGYDFSKREAVSFAMLPDQKSNRATPHQPAEATIQFAGETESGYQLELLVEGKLYGRYEMAKDRLHVMLRYEGADGLRYELSSLERTNYWTIKGE
jgi:hypothetical protein